jgi:hypothetical protein
MTTLTLTDAAIGSGLAAELPPISLSIAPGTPTIVAVETSERPMILSLAIAGRIALSAGEVLIDGKADAKRLRRSTALVDTPFVAEPSPGIPLSLIVAEELTFAGLPSHRGDVRQFLESHELLRFASVPMRALPPVVRVKLLSELATLRPEVRCIVVTSPERHGGNPRDWYGALAEIAARDIAVVIVTDQATQAELTFEGSVA